MSEKRKTKKIIAIVFGAVFLVCILPFIIGVSLLFYNPFLAPMLVNYYSNESNFHHYSATLTDFSLGERGYVNIESVYLLEEGSKTPVNEKGATVFSPYIEITWELFHPTAGMQFEFIGSFRIFYDGGSGAIVSITVGDETILSFEDGQKALLEWAKTVR